MQQHSSQNPNPLPLYSHSNHLYTTNYPSHYHPTNPNPNPNPNISIDPHQPHYTTGPAFTPYASVSSLAQIHGGGGGGGFVVEAYQPHVAYPKIHQTAVSSGYYQDPNSVASLHNWSANGVIPHYGSTRYATGIPIPPNGPVQLVPANANSTSWPNALPRGNKKTWKRVPHKTKVVQSVWCEVCKVECDTKDVLDKHKLGKKHKKNLDKLKEAAAAAPPPVASNNPVIGPQENPVGKGKGIRKAAVSVEDFESRKERERETFVVWVMAFGGGCGVRRSWGVLWWLWSSAAAVRWWWFPTKGRRRQWSSVMEGTLSLSLFYFCLKFGGGEWGRSRHRA